MLAVYRSGLVMVEPVEAQLTVLVDTSSCSQRAGEGMRDEIT